MSNEWTKEQINIPLDGAEWLEEMQDNTADYFELEAELRKGNLMGSALWTS